MTINAMAAPLEAIKHGWVDPRVTSDESGHDGFAGDLLERSEPARSSRTASSSNDADESPSGETHAA